VICAIVAAARLRCTCHPPVTLNVCRVIVAYWSIATDADKCLSCGRPVRVCWVVTEL
jgi:hypothetical protein